MPIAKLKNYRTGDLQNDKMEYKEFLIPFQEANNKLNKKLLSEKQVEAAVVEILRSVCLKLYKKAWSNSVQDPLNAESRIFFSVWISNQGVQEQKLYYNIHAFKLRKLKGYSIQSRKFAETFRQGFKKFEDKWENVSTDYGPLTLMEGWINLDRENIQRDICGLADNFLEIEHLIDDTLEKFR